MWKSYFQIVSSSAVFKDMLYKWEQIFMLKMQYERITLIPLIYELQIKRDHV